MGKSIVAGDNRGADCNIHGKREIPNPLKLQLPGLPEFIFKIQEVVHHIIRQ
jgi:hypothetical protein